MEITREINEKGQVVIPKDIRKLLGVRRRQEIVFEVIDGEVKIKPKRSPEEWMKNFLRYRKKGKSPTHEQLDKIYEQSYDLS